MTPTPQQVYEHLKSLKLDTASTPDPHAVRVLVDGLIDGLSVTDTLTGACAHMKPADAVALTATFGDWLRLSAKTGAKDLNYLLGPDSPVNSLFTVEELDPALAARHRRVLRTDTGSEATKARVKARAAALKVVALAPDGQPYDVVIDPSWTAIDNGNEFVHAVGQIVTNDPDDATIRRFIDRTYRPPAPLLSVEHIMLVVYFGTTGLWTRLTELTNSHASFAHMLTCAWDTLEVYVADANASMTYLTDVNTINKLEHELDTVEQACANIAWLHHHDASRLREALDAYRHNRDNTRLLELAQARMRALAIWWNGTDIPTVPATVSVAAASRLCEHIGLAEPDERSLRATRRDIRQRLTAMGITSDLDIDLDEGVAAYEHGLAEAFFTSRQRRTDGDINWHRDWHETVAATNQVPAPGAHNS